MRPPQVRVTVLGLMLAVAAVAQDLGLAKTWFIRANPLQLITLVAAELGLGASFAAGRPRARAFWLGFAASGLSYAAVDAALYRPVRGAITRPFVLLSPPIPYRPSTVPPDGPLRFRLEANLIQFTLAIAAGLVGGAMGWRVASLRTASGLAHHERNG